MASRRMTFSASWLAHKGSLLRPLLDSANPAVSFDFGFLRLPPYLYGKKGFGCGSAAHGLSVVRVNNLSTRVGIFFICCGRQIWHPHGVNNLRQSVWHNL